MKKKSIKILIGVAVTVLALWLSFHKTDWKALQESFSRINFTWVVLAVGNVLFSVYIMGRRWQILLRSKVAVPLSDMFRFNIISQYFNIIIPARSGELMKAWLVSRKYKLSGSYVLGTVVIEKFIEYFVIILLGILAPLFYTFQSQLKGYVPTAAAFVAMLPVMSVVIWKRRVIIRWLRRMVVIFPEKISRRLLQFLEKGMEAFALLKDIKMTMEVVAITLLVFASQVVTNLLLFQAYGFDLGVMEALILQVILIIGMAIPSVPGKIGVFEYTVMLALGMFAVEGTIALSFGLMLHLVAYIPKIILGFVFMAGANISLKKSEAELGKFEGEVQAQEESAATDTKETMGVSAS